MAVYGNSLYLHGLTALLTLLIFYLPYTFLLTVGQWLQARSSQRLFYWINKPRVKPFLDAYHVPYKDKHRYWTGLLLCLRCALLLAFAFNTQADPCLNLLAISSVALGLMLMTRYSTAVYRKSYVEYSGSLLSLLNYSCIHIVCETCCGNRVGVRVGGDSKYFGTHT